MKFFEDQILESTKAKIQLDEEFAECLWNVKVLNGESEILAVINEKEIFIDVFERNLFTIDEEDLKILVEALSLK